MNKNEAWRVFCSTGSIEAYLLFHTLSAEGGKTENDVQGKGDFIADQRNDP